MAAPSLRKSDTERWSFSLCDRFDFIVTLSKGIECPDRWIFLSLMTKLRTGRPLSRVSRPRPVGLVKTPDTAIGSDTTSPRRSAYLLAGMMNYAACLSRESESGQTLYQFIRL